MHARAVVVLLVACSSRAEQSSPSAGQAAPSPAQVALPATSPSPKSLALIGLPLPPRQLEPWTEQGELPAPWDSKLFAPWLGQSELPSALRSAAATLFAQGFADPRGCEYREIELAVGNAWSGDDGTVKTTGFVFPARPFAVAWNGLVYPVLHVGAAADLRADVTAMIARTTTSQPSDYHAPASQESASVSLDRADGAKLLLLARLGEASLAEQVWQAMAADSSNESDPYGELASEWAWRLYDRGLAAHMRGDHPLALASLRALAIVQPLIEAEATARKLDPDQMGKPHLEFLDPVPALLADEERRAKCDPRPPLPEPEALATLPVAVRVAILIDYLDEVSARQFAQPGSVPLTSDPIVDGLIKLGTPAVEPLIGVLESDTRMTRSVHFWRDFARQRSPIGVHEAAYAALSEILETTFFTPTSTGDDLSGRGMAGRKEIADRVRASWQKWKSLTIDERWYRELADDHNDLEAWLDAADKITMPSDARVRPINLALKHRFTMPRAPTGARSEALRHHAAPSVSDLIMKRIADARVDVRGGCAFALMLHAWEPTTAKPVLEQQMQLAIEATGTSQQFGRCIQWITEARAEAGDLAVLDSYATWIAKTEPASDEGHQDFAIFQPMWRYAPTRPSIVKASETLFRDGSPWVPLVPLAPSARHDLTGLLTGNLLRVSGFNTHVVHGLADKHTIGTLEMGDSGQYNISLAYGRSWGTQAGDHATSVPPRNTTRDIRLCDWYARAIARSHNTAPRFELFWSEAQRNTALTAMAAWVAGELAKP